MKNRLFMKIIATLCAATTLATTPSLVSANPNLLGKKTERQNKDEDENNSQSDDSSEKGQIKNLIDSLKNAYKAENIQKKLSQVKKAIKKLSKMQDFVGMEPEVAKAIAWAIQKHCFSEIFEDSQYKITKSIFEDFDPVSVEIKNILDRCSNNEKAQKFVAIAIKSWINQAYVNLSIYNEKISNGLELKLRKILARCSKNYDAKKFVAWAIADLTRMKVVPCVCNKGEQESVLSDDNGQKNQNSDQPIFAISVDEEKFEVESENEIELKNILTNCLDNSKAQKFVALAIERLIKRKYFDYSNSDTEMNLKTKFEIENILEKCADSEDAKEIVAAAVYELINSRYSNDFARIDEIKNTLKKCENIQDEEDRRKAVAAAVYELINSYYINDFTESDINKIINLLSKCSNNCAALRKISNSIYALTSIFSTIYKSDIYDENSDAFCENNDILENNLLKIDDSDEISIIEDNDESNWSNIIHNVEINNLINNLNILSNNIINPVKNNKVHDDINQNIQFDLNKDVISDNLYRVFDLLYICINNSDLTGYYGTKSIQQLLYIKNFQDIVKNNDKIKNKIVSSLSKCWSLDTSAEPTHDIIEYIINRYNGKLFNDCDIKTIKTDKKIKQNLETKDQPKDQPFDIYTNSDDEIIDEKTINQDIIDKNSNNEQNKERNESK